MAALLCGCSALITDHQVGYGLNHYRAGLYGQAIAPLRAAAQTLQKTNPPDPRLPEVLLALGDMAESDQLAETYFRKALKAADSLATPDENAHRNALVSAGNFFLARKRPAEALPLLEKAVLISGQNARFARTLHAIDLDNLGQAHSEQKRHAEGRALSLRALQVLDEAKDEPDAARTRGGVLYNLAYRYMEEERYAEAEANYRRSLELLKKHDSRRVKTVLQDYAAMLRKLGRHGEAENLF